MTTNITTDPSTPGLNEGELGTKGPQNTVYLVLSDEERAKGFVRPVHRSYTHLACGCATRMGLDLCETYARDPKFYGATYCMACTTHLPVSQFIWPDGSVVGS